MSAVERTSQLEESLDRQFCAVAEKLGTTPSDALRIFVEAFAAQKGFPFAWTMPGEPETHLQHEPSCHYHAGHAVLPASWREDEDDGL